MNAVPKPTISIEEVSEYEATMLFHDSLPNRDSGQLLLEMSPTNRYVVDFPYNFGGNIIPTTIHNFDIISATLDSSEEKIRLDDKRLSAFSSRQKPGTHSLDKFKKFYKIVKHVKNETYV